MKLGLKRNWITMKLYNTEYKIQRNLFCNWTIFQLNCNEINEVQSKITKKKLATMKLDCQEMKLIAMIKCMKFNYNDKVMKL